jgi:Uma2 family endonuclease
MALMATPTTQAGHWPAPAAGEWTVDMLRELPDDGRRYELLDGVLLVSPAPAPKHQLVAAQLFRLLDAMTPADHRVFFAPVDWQPDERTSLEPDLLIISRDAYHETGTIDTPVAVLEIASPSTARIDRTAKMDRYAQGGIAQYWIVDPGGGSVPPSVTVYDLGLDGYRQAGRVEGEDALTVTIPAREGDPATVTVIPADLVTW